MAHQPLTPVARPEGDEPKLISRDDIFDTHPGQKPAAPQSRSVEINACEEWSGDDLGALISTLGTLDPDDPRLDEDQQAAIRTIQTRLLGDEALVDALGFISIYAEESDYGDHGPDTDGGFQLYLTAANPEQETYRIAMEAWGAKNTIHAAREEERLAHNLSIRESRMAWRRYNRYQEEISTAREELLIEQRDALDARLAEIRDLREVL